MLYKTLLPVVEITLLVVVTILIIIVTLLIVLIIQKLIMTTILKIISPMSNQPKINRKTWIIICNKPKTFIDS
jgi:hypothetical protein